MEDKRTNILIIGAGKGGTSLIELFRESETVDILGVVDVNPDAPGMKLAEELGIPRANDYRDFLGEKELNEIVNVTGLETVQEELLKIAPRDIEVIGGHSAELMWRLVDERKRVGKALAESEERYRHLLESVAEGIAVADTKTKKFKYVNSAICKMLGYTREEFAQMGVEDIHPKDSVKHVISEFESQVRGEKILAPEIPCLRKDGSIIFADIDSTTVTIDGREYLIGLFRDITEQKRMKEELQKSESKYKTLLSNLPQKIFLKDRDSVYVSCNENYARDLKIRPEEIIGKTDYDFFPRDLAEKYRADDRRVRESGKTTDIEESYIEDGRETIVHTVKTPVKDEKGDTTGILGIFWDITEHKKAELEVLDQREKLDKINKELKWKIEELEAALNHIKRLEGLIPICMNCKKMRLEGKDPKDPEAWVPLEKYIATETNASLTHGLCPDCLKKLYGK